MSYITWAGRLSGREWQIPLVGETECPHDYPAHHRIGDAELGGSYYCIMRCSECSIVWAEATTRSLFRPGELGIPIELEGARLDAWVSDESRQPLKEAPPWRVYFDGPTDPDLSPEARYAAAGLKY